MLRHVSNQVNLSVKPDNRRVVAVHTVPVTYLTVGERPPTKQETLDVFRRLYLEAPAGVDVLDAWQKAASELDLRGGDVWLKIAPFLIQPKASRMMSEVGISPDQISQLARRFTSDAEDGISSRFGIPVIPSVAGDTVETALVFTFNDSGAAQRALGSASSGAGQQLFAFPEPSWIVELGAKDFRYVRSRRPSPGGNEVDVIDVAMALELQVRAASPSHPIAPLQTTFMKREVKAFIDPSRIVQPSADTNRLGERLMNETFDFMVKPSASGAWLKTAHVFPERSGEVQSAMQRFGQQFTARRR